jgi:hypothetical protein
MKLSIVKIMAILSLIMTVSFAQATENETYVFDFENNSLEDWAISSSPDEQSIDNLRITTQEHYEGNAALALDVHLDDSFPYLEQGMAGVMLPGNMENRTISVHIKLPPEASGHQSFPNGVQLFVKDINYRCQMSQWKNIGEYGIPTDQWEEITFRPTSSGLNAGYTQENFDPKRIILVGIKIAAGDNTNPTFNTSIPFQGTIYIDSFQITREKPITKESDNAFQFNELTNELQTTKPFGYGPFFDIDPAWGANAWHENDISVSEQQIVIQSTFEAETCQTITTDSGTLTQCDGKNKGYIGTEIKPFIDISNKDHRIVRAEIRFDPPAPPENIIANIFVFDNRDSGDCMPGNNCYWYRSENIPVGGKVVNEISFDLNNPDQFYIQPENKPPEPVLSFESIHSDSLKNILKIGIQLYANQPYTGKIYLDNVTIGGTEKKHLFNNLNKGFVVRNASELECQGQPFRFAGANNYYLFYKSHYMIDDVMKTMKENNITVLRTWGFADGKAKYSEDNDNFTPNGNEGSSFQPEAGLFHEPTFKNFDYIVKSAGEHGIRLIIPMVNYWSDIDTIAGQNAYGGMAQYLEWCGISPEYENGEIINKDMFYSNDCAKNYYKAYVKQMLDRVNTLTGIAYKDDPTILAWELANEPRCHYTHKEYCSQNEVYQWVSEMSAFIKQNDPNHMVGVGDEGLLNQSDTIDDYYNGHFGMDWEKNLSIESIDFGTVHLYPDHWGRDIEWSEKWITDHIELAEHHNKPIIFEEFGIMADSDFDRNQTYKRWLYLFEQAQNQSVDGDLFWMIAGKVNGENEEHELIQDNYYYKDYDHFTVWETSDTLLLMTNHSHCMKAASNCLSAPIKPQNIEIPLSHMNGVSLTGWDQNVYFKDIALDQLVYDNANWVAINAWFYQNDIHANDMFKDESTPSDDSLIDVINDAHKRGISVFLKVNLDSRDGKYRGLIAPKNIDLWFANYQAMMTAYAKIAQDTHVELFSVGCEFNYLSDSDFRVHWETVIKSIKAEYAGKLVYAANWDEYENVCFWDLIDFIGIDAYFPLNNHNDISRQDIFDNWTDSDANFHKDKNWFKDIDEFRQKQNKSVIFTEIGYPSANGAADTPWANTLTEHNETIQANCVAGTLDFWSQFDWFQGLFLWEMMADLSDHQDNTGNTHILNGKQVESVIRQEFADPELFSSDNFIPTPFFPGNHQELPSGTTFSWSYTVPPTTNNFTWENNSTEGWYPDTYEDSKAILDASFTTERVHNGSGALKCHVKLKENAYGYDKGNLWVDLAEPVNLSGKTISVALWIPGGLVNSQKQNGIQLSFKDSNWRYVDTDWQNIKQGNQWIVFQASLPSDINHSDGADITKIQHLGFKIGAGGGSQVDFDGYIYVDDYLFESESAVTYHIQVASDHLFSNIVIDQKDLTTIYYQTDQSFEQGKTYYWHVRSQIEDTWNEWSKVADFSIYQTEPEDTCKPPVSGNWIVSQSCTMKSSATVPENVRVQSLSVLTLPDGVTLDIDLKNYSLTVEKGSGVLIKKGATIK